SAILFATGRGAPQGFPFVPVVKVTGNARTWSLMREHMDCSVAGVIDGAEPLEEAARRVFDALMRTCRGEPTAAERCGYVNSMNIWTTGPTI
ncbi:MAG: UxaA family hydrolase, partial [Mesosutterella sp.]|nr:UxaA family hydrolase [Mesosutterella sp.]